MYFLTVLEAEKSKIEMLSIWFLDTAVSLACRQLAAFSLCPRVVFPQCWGTGREGECALIRTLILLNQSPTLMTSFKFSYSLRGPHLQRQPYWGLGLQHTNFEEDTNLQSILSHFVSNYYHLPALNSTIHTPHWEIHCWSWKQNFLPPTRDTEWRQKKKKIHPNSKYLRTWPSLPWLPTQMQTDTPEASATAALVYWAKIFATEILLFVVWLDFFFFSAKALQEQEPVDHRSTTEKD